MYPNMYNVCIKFEWKLTKHVQDTTHIKNQDGCQSAIFDPIVNQLSWTCILTSIMYVPNLNENWHLACPRYHTFSKIKMVASQPSLIWLGNKLSCLMYVPSLNGNWQSMSKIPHIFKKQNGCQSAIFVPIVKQIVMDMYHNMYNICTKFERKLTKLVQDTTHFQKTRWLPVGHLFFDCEINCHGLVSYHL